MVLTGEKRKEYDRQRYLKNKEKILEKYQENKGNETGYIPVEPKKTNKVNRPDSYKKKRRPKKVVDDKEINEFISSELDSKSRRKLNSTYGKECTSALLTVFNAVKKERQLIDEKRKEKEEKKILKAKKLIIIKS